MNSFIKRDYDYAVRVCAYLSGLYPDRFISIPDLSRKIHIPRPMLNKIIFYLRKAGIISSIQGKAGGVHLTVSPQHLSLLDILSAMGFDSTINECVHHPEICPLVNVCKIHQYFTGLEHQIISSLRKTRITEFTFHDSDLMFSQPVSKPIVPNNEKEESV